MATGKTETRIVNKNQVKEKEELLWQTSLLLKYGCNPNQKPSRIFMKDGGELPIKVLNGKPGYINFLDAFNSWQLVKELKEATGLPAAASFKHVSPAGAAVGLPLTDTLKKIYFVDDLGSFLPLACAYARARGADRMSSYGDWVGPVRCCATRRRPLLLVHGRCPTASSLPGYTDEALEILKAQAQGQLQRGARSIPAYRPCSCRAEGRLRHHL